MFSGTTTLSEPLPVTDRAAAPARVACQHCGTPCPPPAPEGPAFCCAGCRMVFELLQDNGLGQFYALHQAPGRRVERHPEAGRFDYLDDPTVRDRLVDFTDGRTTRVTFHLPAIHCVACVWLLENLFRLHPGIGRTRVDFTRREAAVEFADDRLKLSEVAALLDSIGYPPDLRLAHLDGRGRRPVPRRLWLQVGVAGFVFGNTMLFSLPQYFGLDALDGPAFRRLFGAMSLLLSLPVLLYSAGDYWRSTWLSFRRRRMTMDVPIALGIAAIFLQSTWEVLSGTGEGYFDTLAGLLFFLLCGRVFQQRTYDRLAFDRDYRDFFPLAVQRVGPDGRAERVALAQLGVGDRLRLQHGDLVPADARLETGEAVMDYSFVTGEAEPVVPACGARLHAGGRQLGGLVEVTTLKPVSQGYLTSLWNQDAFRKQRDDTFNTLTNHYSRRFTWLVLGIALAAGAFWATSGQTGRALHSFTGVLIVACPCALALAAPFTLGAAQRLLARRGVFLRNGEVVESLARVDAVVFDKTGTLTAPHTAEVVFHGAPLDGAERAVVAAVAGASSHPLARGIAADLGENPPVAVDNFAERAGRGLAATVGCRRVVLGSAAWLREHGSSAGDETRAGAAAGLVHLALDGTWRGAFAVRAGLRPRTERLVEELPPGVTADLLSGDQPRERERFAALFGPAADLRFGCSPLEKLERIRGLQQGGRTVMMVGDGLNDAGALRQADVGVAVVEEVGAFSPASDVILDARQVPQTPALLRFARQAAGVVRAGFVVSALYNVIGLSFAVTGRLSPVVCAILMPVSSVTVVAFATGLTGWLARRSPLAPLPMTNADQSPPTDVSRP
ncbi:MAG: heavy metal translocating P-type ATPase [Limisphaerales bacterium]